MSHNYCCGNAGKHGDMKSKEPGQRCSGDLVSAAKEAEDWPACQRHDSDNFGPNLGCKEGKFVPWQQVSTEPETDCQQQKEYSAKPGYLARLSVRSHEINAEHMNKKGGDHKVGRPAVNRSDQPAK